MGICLVLFHYEESVVFSLYYCNYYPNPMPVKRWHRLEYDIIDSGHTGGYKWLKWSRDSEAATVLWILQMKSCYRALEGSLQLWVRMLHMSVKLFILSSQCWFPFAKHVIPSPGSGLVLSARPKRLQVHILSSHYCMLTADTYWTQWHLKASRLAIILNRNETFGFFYNRFQLGIYM